MIARLPLVATNETQAIAYAIGSREQEPTGTDTSMIILEAKADLSRTKLQSLIKQAGLELAPGEQLSSAVGEGTELEGITAIFLLTDEDHFNALAATTLAGNSETPVYRLAPSHGTVPPYTPGETLFGPTLTRSALTARYTACARITTQSSDGGIPPATDLLFLINPEGTLIPVTTSRPPDPRQGDTLVVLR